MEPPVTISAPARLGSAYAFDTRLNGGRGAFRQTATGRVVGWDTVRGWLDGYIDNARQEALGVYDALADGRMTLAEAELRMRDITADAHLAAAVLEKGGFAQMSPADYGRVGRLLFNPSAPDTEAGRKDWGQYQFLRGLFREVEAGRQPVDGNLARRLMGYVEMSRHTYHVLELRRMAALGFDRARRVLHSGDSCTTADSHGARPGCKELAAAGWMPIGDMPAIGETSCLWGCKCGLEFANSATGGVAESGRAA